MWPSWGWCKNFASNLASIGHFVEGAQFGVDPLNIEVLGSLGPPPTPTSIGHLVEIFRGGMLRALMWCGSAGDHSCAVFENAIGHLVEDSKF